MLLVGMTLLYRRRVTTASFIAHNTRTSGYTAIVFVPAAVEEMAAAAVNMVSVRKSFRPVVCTCLLVLTFILNLVICCRLYGLQRSCNHVDNDKDNIGRLQDGGLCQGDTKAGKYHCW